MEIDISTPEGNTLTALGIATAMMRKAKRRQNDIDTLQKKVFNANSAKEARDEITKATYGAIIFVNSNER